MIRIIPVSGLANRMRAISSALSLSKILERDIEVVWLKHAKDINCYFSDLFEPIENVELKQTEQMPFVFRDATLQNLYLPMLKRIMSGSKRFDKSTTHGMQSDALDLDRFKAREILLISGVAFFPLANQPYKMFVPIVPLHDQIEEESQHFDEYTIGIHIRRTDHYNAIAHSPLELFEQAMEGQIALEPNTNFYLVSDCPMTKKILKREYGDRILTNFDRTGRTSVEGMQRAVVELYTLSKTNKIFGSYWSSFSHTAAQIGNIPEITIKIDS